MLDAIGTGLSFLGAGLDIAGGRRQARRQRALFEQFRKDLARREEESITLERIARGEIHTSLADARQLFQNAIQGISAAGNASSRRFLENIAAREAEEAMRVRRSGMTGGTVGATRQAIVERQRFRGALDASGQRAAAIADVQQRQAAFEAGAGQQLADSVRNEAAIRRDAGRDLRQALEGTQINFTPVGAAFGALGAELSAFSQRRSAQQAQDAITGAISGGARALTGLFS